MPDIELRQEMLQLCLHLFHYHQVVDDDVCCQGIVGGADGPYMYVVRLFHMRIAFEGSMYLVHVHVFRNTINKQAQAAREQIPGRDKDDNGDDDTDNGVDDIPACVGDDEA